MTALAFLFVLPFSVSAQRVEESRIVHSAISIQDENVVGVSFDIENEREEPEEMRYGIRIVREMNGVKAIVDEQSNPQTITVFGHSSSHQDFLYAVPKGLDGNFDIVVAMENTDGVPFGSVVVGQVAFTATGIWIDQDSCFLKVSGEDIASRHKLSGGAVVSTDQDLVLSCSVKNYGIESVPAIPIFTTHFRTLYGDVVKGVTGGSAPTVSVAPGKRKIIEFSLPKASDPQNYVTEVVLVSSQGKTNAVSAHYAVKGESASITGLSSDKTSYRSGDTASVSFLWESSADRISPSAVAAVATLVDGVSDAHCGSETVPLAASGGRQEVFVPIGSDCENPRLTLVLRSVSGADLATRVTDFHSNAAAEEAYGPESASGKYSLRDMVFLLALIPVIAVIGLILIRRKRGFVSRDAFRVMIFAVFFSFGAFFGPQSAEGGYCTGSGAATQWCFTAGACSPCPMPGSLCTAANCQALMQTTSLSSGSWFVASGGSTTITWGSANAASCTLNGSPVATSGSMSTGVLSNPNTYPISVGYWFSCAPIPFYGSTGTNRSVSITIQPGTPPASCTLPWGGTLSSGSSVTAYQSPSGTTCYSQPRTCSNGSLSGSYQYGSCVTTPPASCTLPWGGTLSSGSSVTAYQSPSGTTCYSQPRTCSNGSLSGSYQYGSCVTTPPPPPPPPNQVPTASISLPAGNPTTDLGDSVSFSGFGNDPDGFISSYQWREGNCFTGTPLSVANSFSTSALTVGVHDIYFRVRDNAGAWSTNCPSRTVTVNPAACVPTYSYVCAQTGGNCAAATCGQTLATAPDCVKINSCGGQSSVLPSECVSNGVACSGGSVVCPACPPANTGNWREVTPGQ
jgi:hypothetical protein